uniref:Uncharacterized protein n=1 Tax=Leersia perrieri TaxID=77586 RepID=A0A0D9VGX2_9ORYZ
MTHDFDIESSSRLSKHSKEAKNRRHRRISPARRREDVPARRGEEAAAATGPLLLRREEAHRRSRGGLLRRSGASGGRRSIWRRKLTRSCVSARPARDPSTASPGEDGPLQRCCGRLVRLGPRDKVVVSLG